MMEKQYYSEYNFIKTTTAGNTTLFVVGEKALEQKDVISGILIEKKNVEAEQIAFLSKKESDCVMNMAGDELCGGAILASPVILDKYTGETDVFTVGQRLPSFVTNRDKNKIYTETVLPGKMVLGPPKRMAAVGVDGYRVNLDGISYFVTKEKFDGPKGVRFFSKLDEEMQTQAVPCIGLIEILDGGRIIPTLWVKKISTINEEKGCTTGTISAQLSFPRKDGWWLQPSGESIRAKVNGAVEIEAAVEKLAEGNVCLSKN